MSVGLGSFATIQLGLRQPTCELTSIGVAMGHERSSHGMPPDGRFIPDGALPRTGAQGDRMPDKTDLQSADMYKITHPISLTTH
jgi:hypothetical protein